MANPITRIVTVLRDRSSRPSTWVVAQQAVEVLAQTAATWLAARALGPVGLGQLTVAMALAGALAILLLFGLSDVAIAFYVERKAHPASVMTAALRQLARGALLVALLAVLVLFLMPHTPLERIAGLLAVLTLLLNGLASVANQPLIAAGATRADVPRLLFARTILVVGVGIAAQTGDLRLVLGVHVVAASLLAGLRLQLIHSQHFKLRLMHDVAVAAELRSRSAHIGWGAIFGSVSQRADTLMLGTLAGAAQTGFYGAATRLTGAGLAIAQAVATATYPNLVRARQAGRGDGGWRRLAVFFFCGSLTVAALGRPILGLVFGPSFASAGQVLQILALGSAIQLPLLLGHKWLIANGREAVLPRAQLAGASATLVALWLLCAPFGSSGAAWSFVIGQVCHAAVLVARADVRRLLFANLARPLQSHPSVRVEAPPPQGVQRRELSDAFAVQSR